MQIRGNLFPLLLTSCFSVFAVGCGVPCRTENQPAFSMERVVYSPQNPSPGYPITLCYDFSDLEATEARLELSWTPDHGEAPRHINVSSADPCVTIQLPVDLERLEISSPQSKLLTIRVN